LTDGKPNDIQIIRVNETKGRGGDDLIPRDVFFSDTSLGSVLGMNDMMGKYIVN
jgi:hypothetical protein